MNLNIDKIVKTLKESKQQASARILVEDRDSIKLGFIAIAETLINDPELTADHPMYRSFQVDEENREILKQLIDYFCSHTDYPYELGRGITLLGNVGSGKSLIFKSMQALGLRRFEFIRCLEVSEDYDAFGPSSLNRYTKNSIRVENQEVYRKAFCFDDLGREPVAKYYGKEVDAMIHLIDHRWEYFSKYGVLTHFTTNLNKNEIKQRYGERTLSRLEEMTKFLVLGGSADSKDRRKWD